MNCRGAVRRLQWKEENVQRFIISNTSVTHSIIAHYRVARLASVSVAAAAAAAGVHHPSTPASTPWTVTTYGAPGDDNHVTLGAAADHDDNAAQSTNLAGRFYSRIPCPTRWIICFVLLQQLRIYNWRLRPIQVSAIVHPLGNDVHVSFCRKRDLMSSSSTYRVHNALPISARRLWHGVFSSEKSSHVDNFIQLAPAERFAPVNNKITNIMKCDCFALFLYFLEGSLFFHHKW